MEDVKKLNDDALDQVSGGEERRRYGAANKRDMKIVVIKSPKRFGPAPEERAEDIIITE